MSTLALIDSRAVRRVVLPGAVALAAAIAATTIAHAHSAPSGFADLAARVSPAVVNISVHGKTGPAGTGVPFSEGPFRDFMERFFGRDLPDFGAPPIPPQGRATGLGSGFLIDADGHIVTNDHVVGDAKEIRVRLQDGSRHDARLIGSDPRTDLALMKIDAGKRLPFLRFGDSDRIRTGDWVMTVGNPFGLGGTVTAGIVSARGRDLPGGTLVDFLQIDAPINRGSSGGPSFNADGDVIGVNTAIFSPTGGNVGIGFAIPSNTARGVIANLRTHGTVERGWLGVKIQAITPDMAEGLGLESAAGALVASIEDGAPAEEAGLRAGDVIAMWAGDEIDELRELPRLVAATPVGRSVEVEIVRNGERRKLIVETGRMPAAMRAAAATKGGDAPGTLPGTGVTVADLDDRARARYRLDAALAGALVRSVAPDGPAAAALRPGDVITRVAATEIRGVRDAVDAVAAVRAEGRKAVTLLVDRGGESRFVAIRFADV